MVFRGLALLFPLMLKKDSTTTFICSYSLANNFMSAYVTYDGFGNYKYRITFVMIMNSYYLIFLKCSKIK